MICWKLPRISRAIFLFTILCIVLLLAHLSQCKDLYSILGLNNNAEQNEIKRAYNKLARKWHPDRNKSNEAQKKFIEISKAYEILKDPQKKQKYDLYGETEESESDDNDDFPFTFKFQGGAGEFFQYFFQDDLNNEYYRQERNGGYHDYRDFYRDSRENGDSSDDPSLLINLSFHEYLDIISNQHANSYLPHIIYLQSKSPKCYLCAQLNIIMDKVNEMLLDDPIFKIFRFNVVSKELIPSEVQKIPSIIFVSRGNVKEYIANDYTPSGVIDFAHECYLEDAPAVRKYHHDGNLVDGAVHVIDYQAAFDEFILTKGKNILEKILQNRVNVILYSMKHEPTALEKEVALRYAGFINFGHVIVDGSEEWLKGKSLDKNSLPALEIFEKLSPEQKILGKNIDKKKFLDHMKLYAHGKLPLIRNVDMLQDFCQSTEGQTCVIYSHQVFSDSSLLRNRLVVDQFEKHVKMLKNVSENYKIALVTNYDEFHQFFKGNHPHSKKSILNSFLLVKLHLHPDSSTFLTYTGNDLSSKMQRWIKDSHRHSIFSQFYHWDLPPLDLSYSRFGNPFSILYKWLSKFSIGSVTYLYNGRPVKQHITLGMVLPPTLIFLLCCFCCFRAWIYCCKAFCYCLCCCCFCRLCFASREDSKQKKHRDSRNNKNSTRGKKNKIE